MLHLIVMAHNVSDGQKYFQFVWPAVSSAAKQELSASHTYIRAVQLAA